MSKQETSNSAKASAKSSEAGTNDAEQDSRRTQAEHVIRRHAGYSAVAGLIPLPLVDVAAITALQVKMLAEMSAVYEVPFSENAVKGTIAALFGGSVPVALGTNTGFSLMKAVPGVGTVAAIAIVPGFAAALTWAIGRVFLSHFESGGTTLDFDAGKMKARFQKEFNRALRRNSSETTEPAEAAESIETVEPTKPAAAAKPAASAKPAAAAKPAASAKPTRSAKPTGSAKPTE